MNGRFLLLREAQVQTHVLARHFKSGREAEMIRSPDYAPRVDELKRFLRMELENQMDPSFAEYRRRSLDKLPGVRISRETYS